MTQSSTHYKEAGVDVEAGDQLVTWLQETQKSATGPRLQKLSQNVVSGIGGFAALFRFQASEYKKPCLVSCTDGVGTKVKLASEFQNYSTVGQDLVAMCVNDLITCGAEPLFFLDYYATGKLKLPHAQAFLKSVRDACERSSCLLIGGETAEMPGVYSGNDFDCAGFAVGVVEEDEILGPNRVRPGARVLGISSSGFHSNGYSLIRRVFEKDLSLWQERLLTPTHLYVDLVRAARSLGGLMAMAHITGGGIQNLPRVLPPNVSLKVKRWPLPDIFQEVINRTQMSEREMLESLNCGIGFVLIIEPRVEKEMVSLISKFGFKCFDLGTLEESSGQVLDLSEWESL